MRHAGLLKSDKVLINGVDVNIELTRAPDFFYLLLPSDDNKLRIKNLDATLLIIQVDLQFPLHLAHANVLGMKCKTHYRVKTLKSKSLLRVPVPSKSLSIMYPLHKLQNLFYHWLKNCIRWFCNYKSVPLSAL